MPRAAPQHEETDKLELTNTKGVVNMLRIDCTVKKILYGIEQAYNEDVCDYRGRVINKKHVMYYLFTSYYRIREIVKYISRIGQGKKILDIGIGYGFYDIILKEDFGLDVTGMEIEANIPAYCLLPKLHDIEIIPGQLSKTPCSIPDNSFDIVIFAEVIEHLRISPLRALLEIKRILKPGGLLLLKTPNMARLSNVLALLVGKNVVERFPDDDTGLTHITDVITHIREYTMKELKILMNRAGYKIIKSKYSLSRDRIPPRHNLNWKRKFRRLMLMPVLRIIPTLRSSILILGQKVK